jgi:hypothetical protein
MFDFFQYKQSLWQEYNNLFNKYSHINDSYSVNVRLLWLDPEASNWDSVGGALQNWSSILTQTKWRVYENIPLFQNAPSITQTATHQVQESLQAFTATIKFTITPKPNDMVMFYDDASATVYKINDVRFHRTIEDNLKVFECDLESAPVSADTVYDNLNVLSHEYLDQFNFKLFDFETWMNTYQPVLDQIESIITTANNYFDWRRERYNIDEFNSLVQDIKRCSKMGSITRLGTPFSDCDDKCIQLVDAEAEAQELYNKLLLLKDILC